MVPICCPEGIRSRVGRGKVKDSASKVKDLTSMLSSTSRQCPQAVVLTRCPGRDTGLSCVRAWWVRCSGRVVCAGGRLSSVADIRRANISVVLRATKCRRPPRYRFLTGHADPPHDATVRPSDTDPPPPPSPGSVATRRRRAGPPPPPLLLTD